jgi:hypothetical protein
MEGKMKIKYLFCLLVWFSFTVLIPASDIRAEEPIQHGFYLSSAPVHPEIPRINAFVAKKLFDQGKLILANAMGSDNYEADHLVGSIHLETNQHKWTVLPVDIIVAIYCN